MKQIPNNGGQPSVLALDAAVEGGRADERGHRFAVATREMRGEPRPSATAANEIKDSIQDSVRKVEDGPILVAQSGRALGHIVACVKTVRDLLAGIAARGAPTP